MKVGTEARGEATLMDYVHNGDGVPQAPAPCPPADLDEQFAQRFDRTASVVHPYIRNLLKGHHRQVAEDLTNETFAKAWEKRSKFDPTQDELAWFLTIARNAVIDYLKRICTQKRRPVPGQAIPGDDYLAIGTTLDTAARPPADPAHDLIRAEQDLALEAAIDQLESLKREVITFRRAGLSYAQIAEKTGIPEGTVGSILKRTTEELKTMLSARVE